MDKKLFLVALIFLLNACAMFPNLGKEEEKYGNEDDRVSILKSGSKAFIDYRAESMPVTVPKVRFNNKWYKSHGFNELTPENISSPLEFNERAIESIGKKTSKTVKYRISPIIAKDKIFTIDSKGKVTAFDVNDIRNRIWVYNITIDEEAGNFSNAGILYNQGRIFISSGYNKVVALDAETGELIWERLINGIARSAPDAHDGILLVNTAENKLYALDIEDGAILWNHNGTAEEISVLGTASPVAHGNLAFASYSSGELYALNIKNGNIIWFDSLSTSSDIKSGSFVDIDSAPLVVGNKIFVINHQGVLAAYSTFSGERIWDIEVSGGKNLWYADGYIYLVNNNSQLIAVNTEVGGIAWIKQLDQYKKPERKIGKYNWVGPVLAQNRLLVAGEHGVLLSISPKNGEILDKTDILQGVSHSPVVAHDTVYTITQSGKLVIYKYSEKARNKSLTEKIKNIVN